MIEQITVFDLLGAYESRFSAEIKTGSGFEGGRVRIYCASRHLGLKELAAFMKEEYGIGGHSITFPDGVSGFADHSPKGIVLREFRSTVEERHTWMEAAKEVKRLILAGDYLTEEEKAKAEAMKDKGTPKPGYGWEASA